MISQERFDSTLGLIYDSATDDSHVPSLLAGLAALFDAHFADSFHRTVDYAAFSGTAHGLDPSDYNDEFLNIWVKRNVWGRKRPVVRAGDILTTRDMISIEALKRSEMFNDYLDRRDLHEGLRLDLFADRNCVEDISLLRSWKAGAFDASELRAAGRLMPHLRRARLIARQLRDSQANTRAGFSALDRVQTPMVLLDRTARVIHDNFSARRLMHGADGLTVKPSGLLAATPQETRRLHAMIARAARLPGEVAVSGGMRIQRPSGAPPLLLIAMPLHERGTIGALAGASACVLLTIIDQGTRSPLIGKQLMNLFDLTQAEAALAIDLLAGDDLRVIAERSRRSVHTVRSLLARIMSKTETRRQSELIHLLSQLPGHS